MNFSHDALHPRCHFLPPHDWMNDPNGPIQWRGRFHLFYQYHPFKPVWGPMHWGHAVSDDLVDWTHLPIALAPTPDLPDAGGCFSGGIVPDSDGETALLYYTGVYPETQCLAVSTDHDLRTWTKYPNNPLLPAPPDGLNLTGDFRDPHVWRESGVWRMIVGSAVKGEGGIVLLYGSDDGRAWRYLNPLWTGKRDETGDIAECPDLFPLGDRWILLLSPIPLGKTIALIGTYDGERFTPERIQDCDGTAFYAAKSFQDDAGRRILWGWIREERDEQINIAAGWSGAMSLPRVLRLDPDGTLIQEPAPEWEGLRGRHWNLLEGESTEPVSAHLKSRNGNLKFPCAGNQIEIGATFEMGGAAETGFVLLAAADGSEETRLIYDRHAGELRIERDRSSVTEGVRRDPQRVPFALRPGERLTLRVYVDRSILEAFANGRACVTARVYPANTDFEWAIVGADNGANPVSLDIWELREARFADESGE